MQCLWCHKSTSLGQRLGITDLPFCGDHAIAHSALYEEVYARPNSSFMLPWDIRSDRLVVLYENADRTNDDAFTLWDFAEVDATCVVRVDRLRHLYVQGLVSFQTIRQAIGLGDLPDHPDDSLVLMGPARRAP